MKMVKGKVTFSSELEAKGYIERTKNYAGVKSIYAPLKIADNLWTIQRIGKKNEK